MIRLVAENLVKRFDGVAVVDGAALEVRPGELAFVLGPSGSGKTVLARLLAGLDSLDDGEIYFDGRLVQGLPPRSRGVGFVFQQDALWPHLSVLGNVEYPLKVQGIARRDRRTRAIEALGAARLESLATRRADALTPVQRQRVALARALVTRPDLLILDEPLGRLPERDRAEVTDEIRRLIAEAGVTTLVTTADPRAALALADQVIIMDLGKTLQAGDPATVYNRPVDPFVARFLGPTNLIQGQVESTDARGDVVVRTPLGRLVGRSEVPALVAGASVTLSVRPEALGVGGVAPHNANRFATTVERLGFLGATREVHLRGANDWPLVALTLQPHSQALREGQPLTVHVIPEHVLVLPTRYTLPPAEVIPGSSAAAAAAVAAAAAAAGPLGSAVKQTGP